MGEEKLKNNSICNNQKTKGINKKAKKRRKIKRKRFAE